MIPSLDGRRFAEGDRVLDLREDREGTITATYAGGSVLAGSLAGRRDGADLSFGFTQVERNGVVTSGRAEARLELLPDGRLRVHESWTVDPGGWTGTSVLEELSGPRWVRTRVAHPTADLSAALAFYTGVLGFAVDGPHPATPYEIAFVALPGGAQLELTAGGDQPLPTTRDDLLVLYVPAASDVDALRLRLLAAGVAPEPALNPYWDQMGCTVRDPDGRLVVVAHLPA